MVLPRSDWGLAGGVTGPAGFGIVVRGGTMQEFDPRRPPVRYAPRLLICVLGVSSLVVAWQLTMRDPHSGRASRPMDHAAVAALQNEAFAQAEAQPGFSRPEQVLMKIAPGE